VPFAETAPASASASPSEVKATPVPKRYDRLIMREDYFGPVGFAKEPSEERKRWISRIILAFFLAFILWLFWNRVVNTQQSGNPGIQVPSTASASLPGPL
jgi:hypothetical protein